MNSIGSTVPSLVFAILSSICFIRGAEITLSKGGYQGVVVAIHRDVPENPKIIDNIKAMFAAGSPFMFTATRRKLFFKEVTIVVPESWTDGNYTDVFAEYYSNAHIRVAQPNPDYQDAPYTLQPGECGDQGEYIHLTPKFLTEMDKWTYEMYGDAGRQLVHEWAHFRFGVFDEYGTAGDKRFPLFYLDNGKVVPSSCVKGAKGWALQDNGDACKVYEGGVVGPECRFIPDMTDKQKLQASIMYMPFLPKMADFCDNEGVETKRHNWKAPTKQNGFCNYKSTWEIISAHADIKSSQVLPDTTDTNTTFEVVRFAGNGARQIVLVMDVSSSMSGFNRIEKLKSAAQRFISDIIPAEVSLGMVKFDHEATRLVGMTKISNSTDRAYLSELIPKGVGGATAIGKGMLMSLDVLRENGGRTEGALIILMSDGDENEPPYVMTTLPKLLKAKVTVNTIAIGPTAAHQLETLALKTGGRSFYFPDNVQDVSGWDSAFQSSTSAQVDVEFQPIPLVGDTVALVKNVEKVQTVVIDKELGKNTVFTFRSSGQLRDLQVQLESPSGDLYQKSSPEYEEDLVDAKRKKFSFGQAEFGQWNVTLKANTDMDVSVTLTSEVRDPTEQPVRANAWFDKMIIAYPAHAKVLARVTKGYNVVLNATVKATISRPNAVNVDITLRDNGAGADAIKDDGIYSSFFYDFTGNGRYAAVATVLNDGNAKLKIAGTSTSGKTSGAIGIPKPPNNEMSAPESEFDMIDFFQVDAPLPDPTFETAPVDPFSRNADLGNFQLNAFNPNVPVPPNRVTDLAVDSISVEEFRTNGTSMGNVTFIWTAAGDKMDQGTAATVDLRLSIVGDDLITNFNQTLKMTTTVDMVGAGQEQRVTVDLPNESQLNLPELKETYDIYFALTTINKAKQASLVSNIAVVNIGYKAPPLPEATTLKETTTTATTLEETTTVAPLEEKDDNGSNIGLIVGVVIGVVVAICLITGFVYWLKKR